MSINRVEQFRQVCRIVERLMGSRALSVEEKGNIAMAVEALDQPLQAEQLLRALDKCADSHNLSDACYRILRLAYQDWAARVAPHKPEGYRKIVEMLLREKEKLGNQDRLTDFILISHWICWNLSHRKEERR